MENIEISPNTVLNNHGGTEDEDFSQIINEDRDQDEVDIIRSSLYYLPSSLPPELFSKKTFWGTEPKRTEPFCKIWWATSHDWAFCFTINLFLYGFKKRG